MSVLDPLNSWREGLHDFGADVHEYEIKQLQKKKKKERGMNQFITVGKRCNVLLDVHRMLNIERLDIDGNPENTFPCIANLWSCVNNNNPAHTPLSVAIHMALMKIGRFMERYKPEDSLKDAIGYLALAYDIYTEKLENKDEAED